MSFLQKILHRSSHILREAWVWVSLGLAIIGITLGLTIGFKLRSGPLNSAPQSLFSGRTLSMELILHSVDPVTSAITLDWSVIFDSCAEAITDRTREHVAEQCPVVDIYLDRNLFAGSFDPESTHANNIPDVPFFQYNPTSYYFDFSANTANFQIELATWPQYAREKANLVYYPFDRYFAQLFMFGKTNGTNETVALNFDNTYGSAFGYAVRIPSRREINALFYPGLAQFTEYHSLQGYDSIFFVIERTNLVIAYILIIVVAMWVNSLLLLAIVVKGFFNYKVEAAILVVPPATLFAFTSLRSSFPGAPATFGSVLDFVGTLPSLAILVIDTAAALCLVLFKQIKRQKADEEA